MVVGLVGIAVALSVDEKVCKLVWKGCIVGECIGW